MDETSEDFYFDDFEEVKDKVLEVCNKAHKCESCLSSRLQARMAESSNELVGTRLTLDLYLLSDF